MISVVRIDFRNVTPSLLDLQLWKIDKDIFAAENDVIRVLKERSKDFGWRIDNIKPSALTLEQLTQLVSYLSDQYKRLDRELADAFVAGENPSSYEDQRKELSVKKQAYWKQYQKYKKLQLNLRQHNAEN